MKKINFRGLNDVLSEKELKNVMGGSTHIYFCACGSKSFYYFGTPSDCATLCAEIQGEK